MLYPGTIDIKAYCLLPWPQCVHRTQEHAGNKPKSEIMVILQKRGEHSRKAEQTHDTASGKDNNVKNIKLH